MGDAACCNLHDDKGLRIGPYGVMPVADHDAVVDPKNRADESEESAAENGGDGELFWRAHVELRDDR